MRKIFPNFVFILVMFFSCGFAYAEGEVYTEIQTEATGDNASVHTEITNVVNDKEVKVESDSPGEIKVEINNGEVKVESNTEASPTVVISDLTEEEIKTREEKETNKQVREIREKISTFLERLFSRLHEALSFWR